MKVLVSACLLGKNCKYNGGNNYNGAVAEFVCGKEILSICPELMAGMGCPRTPIEIVDGVLMDRDGKNKVISPTRRQSTICGGHTNEALNASPNNASCLPAL